MTSKTGDLAKCTETSSSSILKYCDQGLLAPVPSETERSYCIFDPRQIPQLYLLKTLRELGLSQEQILDYGQIRTPETTAQMLRQFGGSLADKIVALQAQLDILESHASLMEEGRATEPGKIELRTLPARSIRRSELKSHIIPTKNTEYLRFSCGNVRLKGNAGCPLGYAYHKLQDFLEKPEQPAQLVSFDPQGPELRPAGEYLVGAVNSYYNEKNDLAKCMSDYALQNGLEFCGPAYTVYLLDVASVTDPERYLLQVAVQVSRTQ